MYIQRLVLAPSLLNTVRRRSLSKDRCTRLSQDRCKSLSQDRCTSLSQDRCRSLSQDRCARLFALYLKYSTAFATVKCMIRVKVVYCVAKQYQKSFSRMFKFSL